MKFSEEHLATLVLAYHEGTLNFEQHAQLDAYLAANPDFRSELNDVIYLKAEYQTYQGPSLLKIDLENITSYHSELGHPYEKLAIGQVEKNLTTSEEKLAASLQKDPHYQKIKNQMQFTVLKPDLQIKYPRTEQLIKEIPIRKLNSKMFYYAASSAAALIFAILLFNQSNAVNPKGALANKKDIKISPDKKLMLEHVKKSILHQATQQASTNLSKDHIQNSKATIVERTQIPEGPLPTETIENPKNNIIDANLAIIDPIEFVSSDLDIQNQVVPQPIQNQSTPAAKAFTKEPITVKTFLLQKTNERLFGAVAPSADLRYETMARYANQTIGLPVRYSVEEGRQHDKVVFQFGPISIERSRAKK